jgi:Protein of unknown function (DUF4058)
MDPYLERHWLDVRTSLVSSARDALNQSLPDDLAASAEERIAIEDGDDHPRAYMPDVRVMEPRATGAPDGSGHVATDAPLRLLVQVEPITERFIRVTEAGSERLITVIEFVSPTNKHGEGLQAFRAKRSELLSSGVNFVEIDLVRDGDWRGLLRPHLCPREGVTAYRAAIRLPSDPGAVYLYPFDLRSALHGIVVPLRPGDPEVRLDLQALAAAAYTNGRYDRRLDYSKPPDSPMLEEDAVWADQILRAAGRR